MGERKRKKQSMESVELNENQLDAVSGGVIVQHPQSERWFVATEDGYIKGTAGYSTKSGAKLAAISRFRSPEEISWNELTQRRKNG